MRGNPKNAAMNEDSAVSQKALSFPVENQPRVVENSLARFCSHPTDAGSENLQD